MRQKIERKQQQPLCAAHLIQPATRERGQLFDERGRQRQSHLRVFAARAQNEARGQQLEAHRRGQLRKFGVLRGRLVRSAHVPVPQLPVVLLALRAAVAEQAATGATKHGARVALRAAALARQH